MGSGTFLALASIVPPHSAQCLVNSEHSESLLNKQINERKAIAKGEQELGSRIR